jgi:two-component system chemotaxis response regulator CheY
MDAAETKSIFVIEDDPDIRDSIIEVLRVGGFSAEGASTSREAIRQLRSLTKKPQLILLDLRLPGEDGFQFREEQMRDQTISEIPIVLLSADAKLEEKGDQLGAVGHLRKPVDIDELLDTVRRSYSA